MSRPVDFIRINRSIVEWEWYLDLPVKSLFLHLILSARWKPGKWQGQDIEAGQLPTSLPSLSAQTGLTVQQVRTALEKLRSTGEITEVATNSYRLITLANWANYQSGSTGKATGEQQADNRQATDDQQANNSTIRREEGYKGRREEGEEKSPNGDLADRRDPEVQAVVEFFEAQLGARLDGTVKANRQAAYSLIRKMRKDFPGHDAVVSVKALIQAAREDEFHRKNATGFDYLLRNTMKIIEAKKQRAHSPKHQTDHEYRSQVAAELARRQAERAAHQA